MRRLISLVVVALVMAAMLVALALPALAAPPANKPGQYTCYRYSTGQTYFNVPQGQTALYDYCYPNQY
jgi:hypothetical protein